MLRRAGIRVERAAADFTISGKAYAKGSFVVKTDQAFRPHVIDMFEPQAHPDVFPYPGSPPTPPYDIAGWTLAYQMGIEFDRILDGFNGPFESVTDWNVAPPKGAVASMSGARGYVLSARPNDSFIAMNRLLKANEEVYRAATPITVGTTTVPPGSFYVKAKGTTRAQIEKIASDLGLSFEGTRADVPAGASRMKTLRVGLWDQYGGSMPSGWTRFILEQFEFPFERVYAPQLDAGGLNAKYDVLIFVTGAIPGAGGARRGGGAAVRTGTAGHPAQAQGRRGRPSRTGSGRQHPRRTGADPRWIPLSVARATPSRRAATFRAIPLRVDRRRLCAGHHPSGATELDRGQLRGFPATG